MKFFLRLGDLYVQRNEKKKAAALNSECFEILDNSNTAVLALIGDGGYPYTVPLNFVRLDNKVYFHCAKTGHKIDAVKNCDKASLCVVWRDDVLAEKYTTKYESVIAFGRVSLVSDSAEIRAAIEKFVLKYCPKESEESHKKAIEDEWNALEMISFDIEHLTGKIGLEVLAERNENR